MHHLHMGVVKAPVCNPECERLSRTEGEATTGRENQVNSGRETALKMARESHQMPTQEGKAAKKTNPLITLGKLITGLWRFFAALRWLTQKALSRPEDSRSIWPPPDRPSPTRCVHVHSGVDAPHRPA